MYARSVTSQLAGIEEQPNRRLGTPELGEEVAIHSPAMEWKRERNLSLASPRTDRFHRAQNLFANFVGRHRPESPMPHPVRADDESVVGQLAHLREAEVGPLLAQESRDVDIEPFEHRID